MGDPKKPKKMYSKPGHPWQRERIEKERVIKTEYGLKNKKEIWKMNSRLKNFSTQAKNLAAATGTQAERERQQLVRRLNSLGLVGENAGIDEVLGLQPKDIFERRLQTIVFRKGLARSIRQARQLIRHEHIVIGDKKITSPSYLVSSQEEAKISYSPDSSFNNPDHPERPVDKEKELERKTMIIKAGEEGKNKAESEKEITVENKKPAKTEKKAAGTGKKQKAAVEESK